MKTTIKISGMMCMHCVDHVQKALLAVSGVTSAEVELVEGKATVEYEAPAELSALEKAVTDAGYIVIK